MATPRDPMIFSVAGLIFGFVLGYMVANARESRPPANTTAPAASAGTRASSAGPAAKSAPALDPSEVRALTALAEKEKDNPSVRVELGNLYMDGDKCEDAVRWYREALALVPKNPDIHVDMGACLVRLTRYDDALSAFDTALKIDPAHKKAVFNKGVALVQSGRPKEAIALWEDLLKRNPDDPQLQVLRTQIERLRSQG
jgi:cytochrome c-type biogenesis protein CcmH/NrfG